MKNVTSLGTRDDIENMRKRIRIVQNSFRKEYGYKKALGGTTNKEAVLETIGRHGNDVNIYTSVLDKLFKDIRKVLDVISERIN